MIRSTSFRVLSIVAFVATTAAATPAVADCSRLLGVVETTLTKPGIHVGTMTGLFNAAVMADFGKDGRCGSASDATLELVVGKGSTITLIGTCVDNTKFPRAGSWQRQVKMLIESGTGEFETARGELILQGTVSKQGAYAAYKADGEVCTEIK